jgi:hypothetical protein
MDDPMAEWSTHPIMSTLEPGETVQSVVPTGGAGLVVTDRRVAVAAPERIALNVPFEGIRRIQFDIERQRPATLVIVPEHPRDEPQVLAVPRERYREAAAALTIIGERLHDMGLEEGGPARR